MYLLTTELYLFHLQTEMQMTWNNHQTRAQKQFFAFPQLVIVIIFRNLRQFTKLLSAAAKEESGYSYSILLHLRRLLCKKKNVVKKRSVFFSGKKAPIWSYSKREKTVRLVHTFSHVLLQNVPKDFEEIWLQSINSNFAPSTQFFLYYLRSRSP